MINDIVELQDLSGKKIAFFAGTFDPFHQGHLAIIEATFKERHTDLVVVCVHSHNANKAPEDIRHRLAIAEIITKASQWSSQIVFCNPCFLHGIQNDTFLKIAKSLKNKGKEVWILAGIDSIKQKYYEPLKRFPHIIHRRPNCLGAVHRVFAGKFKELKIVASVSSVQIREALRSGNHGDYPKKAYGYILLNGLYDTVRFVVNIGGRSVQHYKFSLSIARAVAKTVKMVQEKCPHVSFRGKNGGLGGCMEAFTEAYDKLGIPCVTVLTPELDSFQYAPDISRYNKYKIVEPDTTARLANIIKHRHNRLLIVASGGSGTLEELSAAICENEWRIKWCSKIGIKPFRILVVGDEAIKQWQPIIQEIFKQLTDTHPSVEKFITYIPSEYVKNRFLDSEVESCLK